MSKILKLYSMLRLHVFQVKQRYEITPDLQKGANNETENQTHIDFIS